MSIETVLHQFELIGTNPNSSQRILRPRLGGLCVELLVCSWSTLITRGDRRERTRRTRRSRRKIPRCRGDFQIEALPSKHIARAARNPVGFAIIPPMPAKRKKKNKAEIFDSIRKPTAPPSRTLGNEKPEARAHPTQRGAKHKKKVEDSINDGDL